MLSRCFRTVVGAIQRISAICELVLPCATRARSGARAASRRVVVRFLEQQCVPGPFDGQSAIRELPREARRVGPQPLRERRRELAVRRHAEVLADEPARGR
jgi:hypothetical protein